jgi:acyl-CoA thioester hydrolase
MEFAVTYERKVRFSDSDAQGIVFNANYLTYFDDTITDYLGATGIGWDGMTERGVDLVLGRAEVDFRAAGQIGDVLITGAKVVEIGRTSVTFEMRTWDEATGRTVAEGRLIQVMIDHRTHRPTPVPDWFIEAVERLQRAPSRRRPSSSPQEPQPEERASSTAPGDTFPALDPDKLRPRG